MHKNAFLLLKNCKNRPVLASRPLASGGWGRSPKPTLPLRIAGYATAGLRPYKLEGGVETGRTFCRQGEGINVSWFCADVFYGWPLIYCIFFGSCVANSLVCKGVGRNISREGQWKTQDREIAPISHLSVVVKGRTGHAHRTHSNKRCIKSLE